MHIHTHTHTHIHTHTVTQQDFLANAARDQINQKSLSYFTQCDLGSTLQLFLGLLYVIFILVSTRLATFPRCDPSHVILFRFLSAITPGCGLTVWNFTTQANTAACVASPFLKRGRRQDVGLRENARPFILQAQQPSLAAFPSSATEITPHIYKMWGFTDC